MQTHWRQVVIEESTVVCQMRSRRPPPHFQRFARAAQAACECGFLISISKSVLCITGSSFLETIHLQLLSETREPRDPLSTLTNGDASSIFRQVSFCPHNRVAPFVDRKVKKRETQGDERKSS